MPINLEKIKSLTDSAGVGFFPWKEKEIFYIGKATSLRDRVKSYFSKDLPKTRSQIIVNMVENSSTIDFRVTDSVLEALMLPRRISSRNSYPRQTPMRRTTELTVSIITNEDFPRVLTVRKKDLYTQYDEKELKYALWPLSS